MKFSIPQPLASISQFGRSAKDNESYTDSVLIITVVPPHKHARADPRPIPLTEHISTWIRDPRWLTKDAGDSQIFTKEMEPGTCHSRSAENENIGSD